MHHGTRQKKAQLIISLFLFCCAGLTRAFTCPDILESICEDCSEDNKCIKCRPAFYLSQGDCFDCISPCSTCLTKDLCASCQAGFQLKGYKCQSCGNGCEECDPSQENKCLRCERGFKLDSEQQCFSRYAHFVFVGGLLGVTFLVFSIVWTARKCTKWSRSPPTPQNYGSMLDREAKQMPFNLTNYIEDIGRPTDTEVNKEVLSTVEKQTYYMTSRQTLVRLVNEELEAVLRDDIDDGEKTVKVKFERKSLRDKKKPGMTR